MQRASQDEKILSIDIGGSRIKGTLLDMSGNMLMEYQRIATPKFAGPENVMQGILELTKKFEGYTKISVGFPGYVRGGIVYTAPNLGTNKWRKTPFSEQLSALLKKPVRVVNDADLQGLGVAVGKGLEMVITLGTGFGTALLMEGALLPHLEIGQHPFTRRKTYDQFIGNSALEEIGLEKWNKRLAKVLSVIKTVFNYDHLFISGGNSKKITIDLDKNITLVSNMDGIRGGAKLWLKDTHHLIE
ncbi:MAG: ROK family protein [Bacteroidota bacterium]|nr:ROK family protein [Bacteroidota bacterium]